MYGLVKRSRLYYGSLIITTEVPGHDETIIKKSGPICQGSSVAKSAR